MCIGYLLTRYLARLMRILTVTGIFDMVGPDEYAHTPFSLAYIEGHEVDFLKLWFVLTCVLEQQTHGI